MSLLQCDFCNSRDVRWRYEADSFSLRTVMIHRDGKDFTFPWNSLGPWAACSTCSTFIENDQWDELADHSVDTNPAISILETEFVRSEVKKAVLELHRVFRGKRHGDRMVVLR